MPVTSPARDAAPSACGGSGFGPTLFNVATALPPRRAASVFDVCHVGVVLRAVFLVHAAMAIGMVFGAWSVASWVARVSIGSSVALLGVVAWLLVVCAMRQPLAALPLPLQWIAATGLGGASGAGAAWLVASLLPDAVGTTGSAWAGPTIAGAALAGAFFHWLRLRAQATLPAQTTARLAELQSRIRPHFLFNTLNTALTLIRLDPARAESVLEDLAELFRVAIADTSESVTLAEEVALARRYLAIEQVRFGDRLQVTWELDAAAGAARVPPLLLQPLVENAVRHGVEPSPEGGAIRVRTQVRLGRAMVSIVNSVPPEASRPGSGIALRNVKERLRLMHDVAAQIETRRDAGFFRVQIVVPL